MSFTKYLAVAARVLMGLLFVVTGLNGFLNFMPQPPMPEAVTAFLGALKNTGYMLPLIMGTQLMVGVLLVAGVGVPLALALIAPVIVNIVALHAFLEPSGLGLAVVVLALELYLAWAYRSAFAAMLNMRAKPS